MTRVLLVALRRRPIFYGQDAQATGLTASYTGNGDGTVTDNNTGLIWLQSPDIDGDGDIDANDKLSYYNAVEHVKTFAKGGHTDWRLPTIKELYSPIQFSGLDPSGRDSLDTQAFDFAYGDTGAIDPAFNITETVHGAGAQHSDPKVGEPANFPTGHGPQGDAIQICNYVRLVRNAE